MGATSSGGSTSDYYLEISKGNIPGTIDYSAYGLNMDVDTAKTNK